MQLYYHANISDVDSFSSHIDGNEGQRRSNGKARGKMPTSVIDRHLSLDRDHLQGFMLEHIPGLLRINNVCGDKEQRAWDLFYDIIFLDPVTTHYLSQF